MRIRRLPCCKHTRHTRFHFIVDDDIAEIAHVQFAYEHLRVRDVTNENEQAVGFQDRIVTGLHVLELQGFHLILANHFSDNSVQDKVDLGMFHGTLLQDRTCAQFLTPVNDRH